MTISQLKELKGIYLDNINDGFRNYDYKVLKLTEKEAVGCIKKRMDQSDLQVYTDFYYYVLEKDARKKVDRLLEKNEKNYLEQMRPKENPEENLIFPLDEMLLTIVARLNAEEMLFSTIYFVGDREHTCCWWGNYHQEYVIFSYGGFCKYNIE